MDERELREVQETTPQEGDLLAALLEAAQDAQRPIETIRISRRGKEICRFRVRGMLESELQELRKKAIRYDIQNGRPVPAELDVARFRSYVIYEATVPEDRQKLWDNQEAWRKVGVLNAADFIDRVLLAGEKLAVTERILALSGYGPDGQSAVLEGTEELKNS